MFFSCSKEHSTKKIRFLGQKVWAVARSHTYIHKDTHKDRVTTEGTLSGFHDFFSLNLSGSAQQAQRRAAAEQRIVQQN